MTKEESQLDGVSDRGIQMQLPPYLDNIEEVKAGFQAYKSIKTRLSQEPSASRCPVSGSQLRPTDLEQDFTTPGVHSGNLGCPFAKMAMQTNGVPTPPQDKFDGDPIKADFEMRSRSSVDAPPSAAGTAGKCPIRYLDQHSPEEVARYFEDHKHEIPRSHEICVKRYQKNSESIRELDSKYGNLVSMIQGLGVKHQQFLPSGRDGENDDTGARGADSNDAVSQWADDVGHRSHGGIAASLRSPSPRGEEEAEGDEIRTGHFQRPLREIRVGESPSRPWGISVPFAPERPESPPPAPIKEPDFASSSPPQPVQQQHIAPSPNHQDLNLNSNPNTKPPAKCPFDHHQQRPSAPQAAPQIKESHTLPHPHPHPQPTTPQQQRHPSSSMIFNGPVFFGYSADQAAKMLKDMSLSSNV